MATDSGIGAVGAPAPVRGPDPAASLLDQVLHELPAAVIARSIASAEVTHLSVTGKLLAALLQTAPSSLPAPHATPLLAAPATDATVIAGAIRQGIETSGLFYESHLADWIAGQRKLDSLASEPQMRDNAAGDLSAILRQQLDLLDSEPLQWRGELWPGMPLQLQLEQQHADADGERNHEAPLSWTSTLVSQLPALGQVTATLHIEGDRVQLTLQATDVSATLLVDHAAELRDALAAAGLRLQRIDTDGERQA